MMKISVFYLLMLMIAIVTSCSDDNLYPTLEKKEVTIYLDYKNLETVPVPAFSSIVSLDNEIVKAELIDGSVHITGIKEGNTIVRTESKKGVKTEISVVVKYALHNKTWAFINSELNIDCKDPDIKQFIEEDIKQYLISCLASDGFGAQITFLTDNRFNLKTSVKNEYKNIKGTYLYNPAELKLQFEQEGEMQCEFSIYEKDGKRWLSTFKHDMSEIYKEKYPNEINSVILKYSLEAVEIILDK